MKLPTLQFTFFYKPFTQLSFLFTYFILYWIKRNNYFLHYKAALDWNLEIAWLFSPFWSFVYPLGILEGGGGTTPEILMGGGGNYHQFPPFDTPLDGGKPAKLLNCCIFESKWQLLFFVNNKCLTLKLNLILLNIFLKSNLDLGSF